MNERPSFSNGLFDTSSSGGDYYGNAPSVLEGLRGNFAIVDVFTSILALIENLVILLALARTKLAVSGYRRFLLSLSVADILMATTVLLAFLHQKLPYSGAYLTAFESLATAFLRSLTLTSYISSLLSIAGLTIDNFIGVFYQLRYRHLMTGQHLTWTLVFIWLVSVFLGFADALLAPLTNKYDFLGEILKVIFNNGTEIPSFDIDTEIGAETFGVELFVIGLTIPCFFLVIVIYCCIFVRVVLRNRHIAESSALQLITGSADNNSDNNNNNNPPVILRQSCNNGRIHNGGQQNSIVLKRNHGQIVLTTLMLVSSFTFCWMPFILFELSMFIKANQEGNAIGDNKAIAVALKQLSPLFNMTPQGDDRYFELTNPDSGTDDNGRLIMINSIFNSLLMLSPLLNPIIYAVRLPRVRAELIRMFPCNIERKEIVTLAAIDFRRASHRQCHLIASANASYECVRSNSSTSYL